MELDEEEEIEVAKLSCDEPQPWEHGNRIISFMKKVTVLHSGHGSPIR